METRLSGHAPPSFHAWYVPLLLLAGLACGGFAPRAQAQTQEQARAIFLYNFAKFVEWPESAFADSAAPLKIAVVGHAEVARALERVVKGKDANGRDIEVMALTTASGCAGAHIVFVGSAALTAGVMAEVAGKPILTVGEEADFLKAGGVIRLFSQGSKVMCMINVKAADAVGLKLGEKLVKASS